MPRYIIDEVKLEANLQVLASVRARAGVKILLAQKAFSCFELYPLVAKYLDGATASGLFEARLAHEEMPGKENHVFAPAFRAEDIPELLRVVNHIVFNSPRQVEKFGAQARAAGVSVGLRVNPEVSVATTPAYDPCRPGSRLGTTRGNWEKFKGDIRQPTADNRDDIRQSTIGCRSPNVECLAIDGLHFHCLCEQGVEELRKVLAGFEEKFGDLLPQMKWVNFGGGHHITRADYDVDGLVELLLDEATVLEIQPPGADGISNAILDVSAACHMPDVLEMPYTPRVTGAVIGGHSTNDDRHPGTTSDFRRSASSFCYRFGGPTCLAGDEIGTYTFPYPLAEGDRVVFEDMAIYSMVKNNTFNGMPLPDIAIRRRSGEVETIRRFGYADFAGRLG